MKNYFLILVLLLTSFTTSVIAQEWHTDFVKAKDVATKNNKKIVLVFQGSDWCAPCIKLDREIWSSENFKTYSKEHFVMLQADFPRRKKNALPETQAQKNAALAEKYNANGIFPFVVVMDKTGKVLGETSYKKTTPKEYIALLESFKI